MPRRIDIPAGQRTRVFRRRFSSLPQEIEFTAAAASGSGAVSGTVERVGSRWILGRTRHEQQLAPTNLVHKGYWDTLFEVFVTPLQTIVVTVSRPRLRRSVLILTLVVIAAVAAVVVAMLGR